MNNMNVVKVITVLVLLFSFSLSMAQEEIILENATIIPGSKDQKPFIGWVLIKEGEILEVSKKPIIASIDSRKVDCTDKFIVPGLFDAHVHLGTIDLSAYDEAREYIERVLENMFYHGITTVRDMAGDGPFLKSFNEDISKGKLIGPDIFYAAQFAGPEYFELMGRGRGGDVELGVSAWEKAISQESEVADAVKRAKEFGVTGIKVYADLEKDIVRKIVSEAHKNDLKIWSHATVFPINPQDMAELPIHSLSHAADMIFQQIPKDSLNPSYAWQQVYAGMKLEPEKLDNVFELMNKNDIYFDPTLFHALNNDLNYSTDIVKHARKHGVKLVAGTDWIYPDSVGMVPLYDEVKIYAEKINMSFPEILESLTLNAAKVTGLLDRGEVAVGKRADILILNNDPTKDLQHLFQPFVIIKNGNMFSRESLN